MKPVCRRILMTFELGENLARADGDFSKALSTFRSIDRRCFSLSLVSLAAVVLCRIDALRAKT